VALSTAADGAGQLQPQQSTPARRWFVASDDATLLVQLRALLNASVEASVLGAGSHQPNHPGAQALVDFFTMARASRVVQSVPGFALSAKMRARRKRNNESSNRLWGGWSSYSYVASRIAAAPMLALTPVGSRLDAMEVYAGRPLYDVVKRPAFLPAAAAVEASVPQVGAASKGGAGDGEGLVVSKRVGRGISKAGEGSSDAEEPAAWLDLEELGRVVGSEARVYAGEYGLGYCIQKQRKLAAAVLHSAAASLAAAKGLWERRAVQQPPPGVMTTAAFWAWPPVAIVSPDEIPQAEVIAPTADRGGQSRSQSREALTPGVTQEALPRGSRRDPLPRETAVLATSAPSDETLEAKVDSLGKRLERLLAASQSLGALISSLREIADKGAALQVTIESARARLLSPPPQSGAGHVVGVGRSKAA